MRKYETMFIINPELGEESTEALVEKMTSLIEDNAGEVVKLDKIGTRELAYDINDHMSGYYTLINFNGKPETISELERIYKINDNVLRYIILKDE